jgi:hypothetical protein
MNFVTSEVIPILVNFLMSEVILIFLKLLRSEVILTLAVTYVRYIHDTCSSVCFNPHICDDIAFEVVQILFNPCISSNSNICGFPCV